MENETQRVAAEVVRRYSDAVYRLAFACVKNKTDADDVFQEVFLRYFGQPREFESEEHRKAWLLRVTINCSRKLQNSAWFRRTSQLDEEEPVFDKPDENNLAQALARLKPKYRSVVHLFYYEDLSVKRIAELTARTESHVRTLLTRARAQLKELLRGEYDDV